MKIKEYFQLSEVFTYWFRKHDPNRKSNTNIKIMHGINKISMLLFLFCVIVIVFRAIFR
ncbi:MAG: hypothetical protein MUE33_06140 [Cytophagaceae bacterium]|nr:hypothetical protein [Cytophagaceae bacterium]